jgi:hypothetical protein
MPHYKLATQSLPALTKDASGVCGNALKAFGNAVESVRDIDNHTTNSTNKKIFAINNEARNHLRYCGYHFARMLVASCDSVIDNTQNPVVNENITHIKEHVEEAELAALEFGLAFQLSVLSDFQNRYSDESLKTFFDGYTNIKRLASSAKTTLMNTTTNRQKALKSVYDQFRDATKFSQEDNKIIQDLIKKDIEDKKKKSLDRRKQFAKWAIGTSIAIIGIAVSIWISIYK